MSSPAQPSPSLSAGTLFEATKRWVRNHPFGALASLLLIGIFVYFFGFLKIYLNGQISTFTWAWQAWNPETNYEHAKLIPLIVIFLVWTSRDKLKAAPISSSAWGWPFLIIGILCFVAGARTLQARIALVGLPFLFFGIVLYLWGPRVARVLLFPIAFLFFMVPLNFLTQATVKLQFIETGAAAAICNFFGLAVYKIGTTISAANESFHFQIDEGCSGIRSLMAIAMLSAIYGHYTQDRLWKKLALFAASIVFAIIGNAGRLVSIMVVARLFGQDLAGGTYHAVSGFLSFPFAIAAMVLFGKLLNLRPGKVKTAEAAGESVSI